MVGTRKPVGLAADPGPLSQVMIDHSPDEVNSRTECSSPHVLFGDFNHGEGSSCSENQTHLSSVAHEEQRDIDFATGVLLSDELASSYNPGCSRTKPGKNDGTRLGQTTLPRGTPSDE